MSEALAANVFAIVGGVVVTPPLSDGALAGVTRSKILRFAREEGVECVERSLSVADLAGQTRRSCRPRRSRSCRSCGWTARRSATARRGRSAGRLQELFDRRARGG